jgi:hypothetical protein
MTGLIAGAALVRMLNFIDGQEPVSKQELIEYGETNSLPFIVDYAGSDPKGKYRKLDSAILEPLQDDGAVSITEQGRKKMVRLTESGGNTLHAFRYMVESETES